MILNTDDSHWTKVYRSGQHQTSDVQDRFISHATGRGAHPAGGGTGVETPPMRIFKRN